MKTHITVADMHAICAILECDQTDTAYIFVTPIEAAVITNLRDANGNHYLDPETGELAQVKTEIPLVSA